MKKSFLPFCLLLVTLVIGHSSVVAGNDDNYVPRQQGTSNADSYLMDLRVNQKTGLIDPALMIKASQSSEAKEAGDLYWINMGPDNFGGQTSAVICNRRSLVYAGSQGGGVFISYNLGITWHQVGNENLMVSCMVEDEDGSIYVGTGDGGYSQNYNSLGELSYQNGFIGSGIYKVDGAEISRIESTIPTVLNGVSEWSFVNDLAIYNGTLYAATNSGLKISADGGQTWSYAKDAEGANLDGNATLVKVADDGFVIAAVGGFLYAGTDNQALINRSTNIEEDGVILGIPSTDAVLDIAISSSNSNVVYAAIVGSTGSHSSIYMSEDQCSTWRVILPAVTATFGNDVYGTMGLKNHGMIVSPTDPYKLYILGYNLWQLNKVSETGFFAAYQMTNSSYGIQSMAFDRKKQNKLYLGSDCGVFEGTVSIIPATGQETVSLRTCNRNYISSRVFNVGVSGAVKRVIAGALDNGTIIIKGQENANTIAQGTQVYTGDGGHCAISTINPNAIFVTSPNGGMYRSETAGADYDFANFTASVSPTYNSSKRMPIALWESYNDDTNPATVWYHAKENLSAGTEVQCRSNINEYPFNHVLTAPLAKGDSVLVHDPICAKFFFADANGVYFTRDALLFSKETKWYQLTKNNMGYANTPLSMAVSSDCDVIFVGSKNGKLVRLSNLKAAIDENTSSIDSAEFAPVTTVIELLDANGEANTQAITSVYVDPSNHNNVVLTLGNYGNDNYVMYSTNALSETPTFTAKQGNLPKMPVYSSLIEMAGNGVIIGTEKGIYKTANIAAANPVWVKESQIIGSVPVLDLKQQLMHQEDQIVELINQDEVTTIVYPGIKNTGVIYGATYGRGLFRCENYIQYSGTGVADNTIATSFELGMYPNPVNGEANINFEVVADRANVSYQVYDLTGRIVKAAQLGTYTEGSYQVRVSMSDLANGAYVLRLSQGAQSKAVKFLVY